MTVYAGTTADHAALAAAAVPHSYLPKLTTLIPDTQLCSPAQYAYMPNHANTPASPLYRTRAFPGAKYSRYVGSRAWKFLVFEFRSFQDVQTFAGCNERKAGVTWVEAYGEPANEADDQEAALVRTASTSTTAIHSMDTDIWLKDNDGDATMAAPRGLAAFKPTGEADRLLRLDQANAPPKPTAAQQAKPILNRNSSFLDDLRQTAPASSSAAKPPACPQHPTAMMVQRLDRSKVPPAQFYACLGKDATGKSCSERIWI